METSTLVRRLTEQPFVRDLPVDAAQAVLALRYCVLCHRSERDPMPELERRCGASFDEALLAALVGAAGRDDRAAFDWLSAEMLGGDAREMLFVALGNFLRAKAPRRAPND